ncbi:MAG: hypothetical protein KAT68_02220 [Bacteroidales bacterium]|nr:hypothetical protein [Bacteroidales bacterium]
MNSKLQLLILLLFVSSILYSQNAVIYDDIQTKSFSVKYIEESQGTFNNEIITKIARSIPKPVHEFEIKFNYQQHSKIIRDLDKLKFVVEISDIDIKDDIIYKGFPINNILHPCELNFTLNWLDADNKVIKNFNFNNIPIIKTYTKIVDFSFIDSLKLPRYSFEIVSVVPIYNQKNQNKFISKEKIINDYYNFDSGIQLTLYDLKKINLENTEQFDKYSEVIKRTDDFLKEIKSKNLPKHLKFPTYDPNKLNIKIKETNELNSRIKQTLEHMINNMHEAYYNKGLKLLETGETEQSIILFNKSVDTKKDYPPPYYQLAKIEFDNNNFDNSIKKISSVILKMKPSSEIKEKSKNLLIKIIAVYVNEADSLNNNSEYNEAIKILEKASQIGKDILKVKYFENIETQLKNSYTGLYVNITDSAYSELNNNNFVNVENYIDTATSFYNKYKNYIINNEKLISVTKSLYQTYINQGNELNQQQKFKQALVMLENANRLCNDNSEIVCKSEMYKEIEISKNGYYINLLLESEKAFNEKDLEKASELLNSANKFQIENKLEKVTKSYELEEKINYQTYILLIYTGKENFNDHNYKVSLDNFEEAKNMQIQYDYPVIDNLDSLIKTSATFYIIDKLREGERFAMTNDIPKAKNIISETNNIIEKYKIENNEKINIGIKNLNNKIAEQICNNAIFEFAVQYRTAQKFIEQKRFIDAEKSFNKAIDISKQNSNCNIPGEETIEEKNRITNAVLYQQKLNKINKLIIEKSYPETIANYIEIRKLYIDSNITEFNLQNKNLFDFIITNESANFINYAVKHYTDTDEFESALSLLEELNKREYLSNWAKNNQNLLGTKLAIRDHSKHPGRDPKLFVKKYTTEDKWYSHLKKAYLKRWEKLE